MEEGKNKAPLMVIGCSPLESEDFKVKPSFCSVGSAKGWKWFFSSAGVRDASRCA